MSLKINRRTLIEVLSGVALLVILLGTVSAVLDHVLGHSHAWGFVPEFDLSREANIPTFYSTILLLTATGLLVLVQRCPADSRDRRYWGFLVLVFFFLALDEASSLHERLVKPLREGFNLSGWFRYAWVIPAAILLSVFGAVYLRFVLRLAPKIRNLIVLAGLVYVGGALFLEIIEGQWVTNYTRHNLGYALLVVLEEGMEMYGVIIFCAALLNHLKKHGSRFTIAIE